MFGGSLPAVLLAGHLAMPVADGVPRLDVQATCRAAARADPTSPGGGEGCLRSERQARADLDKRWSEFNAAAKRQCTQEATMGGSPSYVELLTCLELATGQFKRPEGAPPLPASPAPPVKQRR